MTNPHLCPPQAPLTDAEYAKVMNTYTGRGLVDGLDKIIGSRNRQAHIGWIFDSTTEAKRAQLADDLGDVLNLERRRYRFGAWVTNLMTAGTDGCKCCIGWRIAATMLATFLAGVLSTLVLS